MWDRGHGSAYGVLQEGAEGLIQILCEQGHMKMIFRDPTLTCTHHIILVFEDQMKRNDPPM